MPSVELERRAGASNLNTFRDGFRVLRTLLREHPAIGKSVVPAAEPIRLSEIRVPSPGEPAWRPAGQERRRPVDCRENGVARIVIGPDGRPMRDRRAPVERTEPVLVPVEQLAATASVALRPT